MIKTLALVLKKQNLGETDRIITIFSPSLGKKRIVAKAVRKPLSKMAGHLDTLMISQIMLTDKPELPTITSAQLVESFEHLRNDLPELDKAYAITKIVEKVIVEDAPQQAIFQLAVDSLVRIDHKEPWSAIWLKFLSDLAKTLGLGLSNFACHSCNGKICEDGYWSEDARTFYCLECGRSMPALRIKGNTIKLLNLLGRNSFERIRYINIERKVELETEEIMLKEITNWFNKPWTTYRALGGDEV